MSLARLAPGWADTSLAAPARCWHVTALSLWFAVVSPPVTAVSPPGQGAWGTGPTKTQEGLNAAIPTPTRARSPHPCWEEASGILTPLTRPSAGVLAHQCPQTGETPQASRLARMVTPSPRPREKPGDAGSPHLRRSVCWSPAPTKPHGRLPLGGGDRLGTPQSSHHLLAPAVPAGCRLPPPPAMPSRPRRPAMPSSSGSGPSAQPAPPRSPPCSPASSGFPERLPPTPTPGRRPAQPAPQIAIPAADVGAGGGGRASAAGNET